MATSTPGPQNRLAGLRHILEMIRDFGMPTVAFGTGIYAFIIVLRVPMAVELQTAVALALTVLGLLAWLWIYSRENPKVQSDEVREQLRRMTDLVEHLVQMKIKEKAKGDEL
jgi:hypothetical protein